MRAQRELHLLLRAELDGKLVGAAEVDSIEEALDIIGGWFQLGGDYEGEFGVLVTSADGVPTAVQVSRNQYLALYFIATTLEQVLWPPLMRRGSQPERSQSSVDLVAENDQRESAA